MKLQLLNLLFLLAPLSRIAWDWYTIEVKQQSIRYTLHNIVTGLTLALQIALLTTLLGTPLEDAILMSWSIYYLLFDFGLNFFRGKPVFTYYGDFSDRINLSFIEFEFYQFIPWQVLLIIKIVFVSVSFYFYR